MKPVLALTILIAAVTGGFFVGLARRAVPVPIMRPDWMDDE